MRLTKWENWAKYIYKNKYKYDIDWRSYLVSYAIDERYDMDVIMAMLKITDDDIFMKEVEKLEKETGMRS